MKFKPRWKEDNSNNIFNTEEVDEDDEEGVETQLITTTKRKNNQPKQRRKTDLTKVTCYDCQGKGYYAGTPACPNYHKKQAGTESDDIEEDEEAEQHIRLDLKEDDFEPLVLVQLMQNKKGIGLSNEILLDNQANVNIFCNPELLTNIRKGPRTMTVNCQAGPTNTDWIGDYQPLKATVWLNTKGIAIILSQSKLIRLNKGRIRYDTKRMNTQQLQSSQIKCLPSGQIQEDCTPCLPSKQPKTQK